jgi:hypothetical protein
MNDEIGFASSVGGQSERHAERLRNPSARRIEVHELHLAARNARGQPCDQAANCASTNHDHPISNVRPGIPQTIERGFEVGGQHGPRGGHVSRQHVH